MSDDANDKRVIASFGANGFRSRKYRSHSPLRSSIFVFTQWIDLYACFYLCCRSILALMMLSTAGISSFHMP